MEFNVLMKVKEFDVPNDISSWVVDQFDSCTLCLNVHCKIILINEKVEENILGVEYISKNCLRGYCNLEQENQLQIKSRTTNYKTRKSLKYFDVDRVM